MTLAEFLALAKKVDLLGATLWGYVQESGDTMTVSGSHEGAAGVIVFGPVVFTA
jgi:hypothetical protein